MDPYESCWTIPDTEKDGAVLILYDNAEAIKEQKGPHRGNRIVMMMMQDEGIENEDDDNTAGCRVLTVSSGIAVFLNSTAACTLPLCTIL